MPTTRDIPALHVEGIDDLHVVANLLERHGVDMAEFARPFEIKGAKSVEQLLSLIPEAIQAASRHPIGFVLDVDTIVLNRWTAVRDQLSKASVDAPATCPASGFVGRRQGYPKEIGVWLMPDCTTDGGRLEDLVRTLIPSGDSIWPHAEASTDRASELGARFSDRLTACLHSWLSWQVDPGRPFGTAIKAKFFNHDSPQALKFLRWLGRLYGLEQLQEIAPAT